MEQQKRVQVVAGNGMKKESKKEWRSPEIQSLGIEYTLLSGSGTENGLGKGNPNG